VLKLSCALLAWAGALALPRADAALGPAEILPVSGGTITVAIDTGLTAKRTDLRHWIDRAVAAVTHYYGEFPVAALRLEVRMRAGEPVNSGREFSGRLIRIHVDPAVTATDLNRDWMLTHEMFHLGFPSLDPAYHYLEEGLSDYLEPLARVRLGQTRPTQPWQDFMEGMPQGLPKPGEGGLDGTRDWGRTYWGGCIFWFLVDLDIRQRTGGRLSLDDAIRAIVRGGGAGRGGLVAGADDADWGWSDRHGVDPPNPRRMGTERGRSPLAGAVARLGRGGDWRRRPFRRVRSSGGGPAGNDPGDQPVGVRRWLTGTRHG